MDDESQNTINHRVVVRRRGGPEMLLVIEEDLPEPAPDEVRIRVEAAGVSGYDLTVRAHRFPGAAKPPFILGEDFVGTVDKVGDGVSGQGSRLGAHALHPPGYELGAEPGDERGHGHEDHEQAGAHLRALLGCSELEPPGESA